MRLCTKDALINLCSDNNNSGCLIYKLQFKVSVTISKQRRSKKGKWGALASVHLNLLSAFCRRREETWREIHNRRRVIHAAESHYNPSQGHIRRPDAERTFQLKWSVKHRGRCKMEPQTNIRFKRPKILWTSPQETTDGATAEARELAFQHKGLG